MTITARQMKTSLRRPFFEKLRLNLLKIRLLYVLYNLNSNVTFSAIVSSFDGSAEFLRADPSKLDTIRTDDRLDSSYGIIVQ